MNAKKNTIMNPSDFYSKKKYKIKLSKYKAEQHILATFNKERVIIDIDGFYSTECFSTDVLKGYYNEII